MSDHTWARASIVLCFLGAVLLMSGIGFLSWKGQGDFKKECVAVAGTTRYDNDGDLECYRNGIEIAEYGENSPR